VEGGREIGKLPPYFLRQIFATIIHIMERNTCLCDCFICACYWKRGCVPTVFSSLLVVCEAKRSGFSGLKVAKHVKCQ